MARIYSKCEVCGTDTGTYRKTVCRELSCKVAQRALKRLQLAVGACRPALLWALDGSEERVSALLAPLFHYVAPPKLEARRMSAAEAAPLPSPAGLAAAAEAKARWDAGRAERAKLALESHEEQLASFSLGWAKDPRLALEVSEKVRLEVAAWEARNGVAPWASRVPAVLPTNDLGPAYPLEIEAAEAIAEEGPNSAGDSWPPVEDWEAGRDVGS